MSNIIGIVTASFDNRQYQGQASKYPSWKIMIGSEEFTAYTNDNLGIKQGDNVSLHFQISKKTGKAFVESDYTTKKPKIQIIPVQGSAPSEEIPLDDDLSSFEPDHHANNGVEQPSDFNYGANASKPIDNKSMQIFCSAMVKSSLESNQLKADKASIQSFIKDMMEVYKASF